MGVLRGGTVSPTLMSTLVFSLDDQRPLRDDLGFGEQVGRTGSGL